MIFSRKSISPWGQFFCYLQQILSYPMTFLLIWQIGYKLFSVLSIHDGFDIAWDILINYRFMCILKLYVPTFKNQSGSEQDLQNTGMAKLSHTQCTTRPMESEIPRYFCPVFFFIHRVLISPRLQKGTPIKNVKHQWFDFKENESGGFTKMYTYLYSIFILGCFQGNSVNVLLIRA